MTTPRWSAWEQPTWRGECRPMAGFLPRDVALSFDGKTWVSVDSLANEPETGKINRTPE